jgi:hypothetical protein
MFDMQNLGKRWEAYRPSKPLVFWAAVAGVAATLIIGFSWGGWVTGGTAKQMVDKAATGARAELMASICVNRFAASPDVVVNLASLKGTDSWKRDDFIKKGGWIAVAGQEKPIDGAAELCAIRLMDAKLPVAKAPG